jgi:uncharacterized protein
MVPLLLLAAGREFGVSASLQHLCSALTGGKGRFVRYDWKSIGGWNLVFFFGIALGGVIAVWLLHVPVSVPISASTVATLHKLGVAHGASLMPASLFSWQALRTAPGFIAMVAGGFLVGFGARYAGGCTSGHGITGLSQFELPSLLAVCGFFAGGVFTSFVLLPLILRL